MKKYFYTIIAFWFLSISWVFAGGLQESMNPTGGISGPDGVISQRGNEPDILMRLAEFVRDFLFSILWVVVVGVFLYFWFKLISAKGNPEELKKVMVGFIYVIVGLAIIPLSLVLVRLVSSINF